VKSEFGSEFVEPGRAARVALWRCSCNRLPRVGHGRPYFPELRIFSWVCAFFSCNSCLPVSRNPKGELGPGLFPLPTGPLRRLLAPNPRYKSRHLSQRATTAKKVKAINRPTRVTSVIVISMLCAPNLSRAETSALCTEKC